LSNIFKFAKCISDKEKFTSSHVYTSRISLNYVFHFEVKHKKIEKLSSEIQICVLKKQEIYKKKKTKTKL
jgi:hypothetical protein